MTEVRIKVPKAKAYLFLGSQKEYSLRIGLYYKPCWFHRVMMRFFFGFHVELLDEKI